MRDLGNTVIVVEHDHDTMLSSDYIIDIGKGAGKDGGKVIFAGEPKDILKCKDSITGQYLSDPIDEKSKQKAYELYDSGLFEDIEVGTIKGLQQIHAYIFGGLYDFAGKIRSKTISKDNFMFCDAKYLNQELKRIELMSQSTIEEIVDKYIDMNIAHPFMEGNGRSTRIWLDQILKKELKKCVDWSKIEKKNYLDAMRKSPTNSKPILKLIKSSLTAKINNREIFMKGIDYSYYYETIED